MALFTDNPVLEREVRGRLRLRVKGSRRAIPIVAWPIGLVALYFYARGLVSIMRGTLQESRDLWPVLVYGALTLIVLLAPAIASTAITQEREQQTWEALAATRLTAGEVLLGKWLGRQIIPWLIIIFAFPFLLVCTVWGALGVAVLPVVLAFLIVTTGFYSMLGLLCSFQARRTVGATATALTVTAFFCVGTLLVNQVFHILNPGVTDYRHDSSVMWLNPFNVAGVLQTWLMPDNFDPYAYGNAEQPYAVIVGFYFLVSVLATAAAARFMISRYRKAVRERT